ncbi:hypothetical protein DCAR_0208441 [Daucus carota subsp. sativus]|uniref:Uncharacterized protein n=1 Tax=Daucus carota subsp. sativus TaxID=79200 RepID=A0AAF1AR41_DAUCS|nr:hypothetical protein DCAR_0208441 [Daucus carota subsp. sativus]
MLFCDKYLKTSFIGLYPVLEGALPEILDGTRQNQGQGGGLEIVFNQQLTRLG